MSFFVVNRSLHYLTQISLFLNKRNQSLEYDFRSPAFRALPTQFGNLRHLEKLSLNKLLLGATSQIANMTQLIELNLDGSLIQGFTVGSDRLEKIVATCSNQVSKNKSVVLIGISTVCSQGVAHAGCAVRCFVDTD